MSKRAPKKKPAPRRKRKGFFEGLMTQFRLARYLTLYTIAYLILAGGVAFALWSIEQGQEADARASLRADWRQCMNGNEAREAIRDAIIGQAETLVASSRESRGHEPSFEDRAQRYLENTRKRLEPLKPRDCGPQP